jgi:hypothetical protein
MAKMMGMRLPLAYSILKERTSAPLWFTVKKRFPATTRPHCNRLEKELL